jgi:DNA repair protein RadC
MSQHIFQFESELQNNSQEAAPSSPSLSPTVSEKLERYGSSALSGVEHLTLILGKVDLALALVRHFGSIKALSRASLQQLLEFLPRRKAETLVAALSMSTIAESEHARSGVFDSPDTVYSACVDMKLFNQEVLRVILLDTRQRLITMIDVTKGGLNESLAHPRDIFRPVISHSAHAFILVHNHPSGAMPYSVLCRTEHGVLSKELDPMRHKRMLLSQSLEEAQQVIIWSVSAWFAFHR